MGKTPLCTDAAEPVAGGTTADKYVSRQHHGVAHRAELRPEPSPKPGIPRHGHAESPHGIPRRVPAPHLPIPLRHFVLLLSSLPPSDAHPRVLSLLALSLSTHFFLSFRAFCRVFFSFSCPLLAPSLFLPPSTYVPLVSMNLLSSASVASVSFILLQRPRDRSRAFIHLNIMEMSTRSWTRNCIGVSPPVSTGSPARSCGEEENWEDPSSGARTVEGKGSGPSRAHLFSLADEYIL